MIYIDSEIGRIHTFGGGVPFALGVQSGAVILIRASPTLNQT